MTTNEYLLNVALLVWILLFHPVQGLAMHQRAAEIADRGWSVKSLFGKMRYIFKRIDRTTPCTSIPAR